MSSFMTSSDLIAAVKRKAMIPTNQSTFTDDDFLAIANDEFLVGLLPSIMQVHEEYYVYSQPVTLIPNISKYPIPYRAVGQRLRDLLGQDAGGNFYNIARISPDDKDIFQQSYTGVNFAYFYVEGNNFILTPNVGANPAGTVVTSFFMRPNSLVANNQVSTIKNIQVDTVNNVTIFTVDIIPAGFTAGIDMDILQTRPGHQLIEYDIQAVGVNKTNLTITFPNSALNTSNTQLDSTIIVGDYVAFAGQCIIPQCPPELHSVLVQRVIARVLDALGDAQGLNNANVKLQEMEQKTLTIITDRVEGAPQKITNRRGLLRSGKMYRRFYT